MDVGYCAVALQNLQTMVRFQLRLSTQNTDCVHVEFVHMHTFSLYPIFDRISGL